MMGMAMRYLTKEALRVRIRILGCAVFIALASVGHAVARGPADVSEAGRRTIKVGDKREIKNLSVAASIAKDGDSIEVDAGDYPRDVAVWTQNNLTVKAVGGRARLLAEGAAAEEKAIWVVRGGAIT